MQEEAVSVNEDDISDPEVVMLDCSKTTREKRAVERKLRSQVGVIDTQLKALGLYEEGLSYEQKEELLAVVAASRESAQHEESMRLRAKEWQRKIYPAEEALMVEMPSTPGQAEKPSSSSDACVSPKVESSMQLLKLDQSYTESSSSQDLFEMSENEIVPTNSLQKQAPNETQSVNVLYSHLHDRQGKDSGTEIAKQAAVTESSPSPSLIGPNSSVVDVAIEIVEDDTETAIEVDFARQKKELEMYLPHWKPCSSPETTALNFDRYSTVDMPIDKPAEYEKFVQSVDLYHSSVKNAQRNSGVFIVWGHPITVGRTYVTRSSRSRGADLENSDGVYSFSTSVVGDNASTTSNSMCESYMRLREFSKCLDNKPSSGSSTLTTVTKTPCQVGKTFLQSNLCLNKASTTKRARTCLRNVGNSYDLSKNSSDKTPFDKNEKSSASDSSLENAIVVKTSKKTEYLVQAEICPQASSELENSKVIIDDGKQCLSPSRNISNSKPAEKDTCKILTVSDDAVQVTCVLENQGETADRETSKRRKFPASLSSFNSPSKRLKETGTL